MSGIYVYGVTRATERPCSAPAGVEGAPTQRVREGELAAIVAAAPEGPVRASRRNLMAHSGVLQEVIGSSCDVLPMRFGTVVPDLATLRELLAAHRDEFAGVLDAVAGKVELDVTVTRPEDAVLRTVVAGDPALAAAAPRLGGYHERIELGRAVAAGVAAHRDSVTRRLLEELTPLVVDATVDAPRHEDELAHVAFLVERARLPSFDRALDGLGAELPEDASVRCVGPLAPYHFAETALEAGAWA